MTYSPEVEAAFESLEAAIDKLIAAFGEHKPDEFMTGWGLIVSFISNSEKEWADEKPTRDVLEPISSYSYYTKRGQDPTLTRGLIEEWRDKLSGTVCNCND